MAYPKGFTLRLCCLLLALAVAAPAAGAADAFNQFDAEFERDRPVVADPLRPWNRAMFEVNDRLYFYVLKPTASIYGALLPEPVRIGVRHFFRNLATPVRFVACLMQGKSERAGAELGAFMVNTTVGGLGFWNPAANEPRLKVPAEDLGQALGVWGLDHGLYLVWPVFGPSSLRDTVGGLGDRWLDPVTYVDPSGTAAAVSVGRTVNGVSLRIGEYEALKDSAVSPYDAMRDGYLQYRARQVEK